MATKEEKQFKYFVYFASLAIMILIACAVMTATSSCCTLSFSNVLTDGTASDVVDDTSKVSSNPDFTLPALK
jgi:hypothetical protein